MKRIFKYSFETVDLLSINMPRGAEILSVQVQHGCPCMWALVDPSAEKVERIFTVHGTGHPINNEDHKKFIGTYQLLGGDLVFHLFEFIAI